MSLRTGEIERVLWRTTLRALTDAARSVYIALRTGPIATMLEGLIEADVPMLQSVLNRPADYVQTGLQELIQRGVIEFDPEYSLVRIIGIPSADDPIKSYKQLQGWWSNWQQLPPSALRIKHVAALKSACDLTIPGKPKTDKYPAQPSMIDAWERTFGTLENTLSDRVSLTAQDRVADRVSGATRDRVSDTPPIPATASASAPASASAFRDLAPPDGVAPSLLQVQEQPAQEPKPKKQPKPKASKPVKLEPDSEPMPFTIREMLAALDGATPKLLLKPYDPAYSKPLTAAIRAAGSLGYGMEDIRLAAEYAKVGGLNWAAEPLQVNWLSKAGSLTTLLGRVRAWRDRGKPPFVQQGGSQGGQGGSSGPGYKSPETLAAEESSRRVQQMAKEAEERRKNLTPEEEAEEARAAASIRNGGWMQIGRAARGAEALAAAGGEDHETAEAEEDEEL